MNVEWITALAATAGTFAWWFQRQRRMRAAPLDSRLVRVSVSGHALDSVSFSSGASGPQPTSDPPKGTGGSTADTAETTEVPTDAEAETPAESTAESTAESSVESSAESSVAPAVARAAVRSGPGPTQDPPKTS